MGLHWLILIAFVLMLVQGRLYRRYGLRQVNYRRSFHVSRAAEGQSVYLVEKVSNRKWLPLPWLRIESQIDAHLKFKQSFELMISSGEKFQNHVSLFSVPPHVEIVRKHKVQCIKRGRYTLSSAYLTTGDILGWNRTSEPMQFHAELLVHPRLLSIEEIPLPTHSWQGDVTVRRWIMEDPFTHAGVREYRPGDPYNRIHWQATARTGALHVVKNDYTADHELMILLNFGMEDRLHDSRMLEDMLEHGIRYAASLAQHYSYRGMKVGFGCNGRLSYEDEQKMIRIAPLFGEAQLQFIYDTMASLLIMQNLSFETLLDEEINRRTQHVDYMMISADTNEGMKLRYQALEKNGNSVTIVPLVKPADRMIPERGS